MFAVNEGVYLKDAGLNLDSAAKSYTPNVKSGGTPILLYFLICTALSLRSVLDIKLTDGTSLLDHANLVDEEAEAAEARKEM